MSVRRRQVEKERPVAVRPIERHYREEIPLKLGTWLASRRDILSGKTARVAAAALPKPSPKREGFSDLVRQFHAFLNALWSSQGRYSLVLLTVAAVSVICATTMAQVALNA